uniref:DNA-methyltransferase n=1 Tax=Flexibacterium corallicola TaxID=3037259 RepID=UPI00286EE9AE
MEFIEEAVRYGRATLLHGDCLERMAELPDQSIDLILTDPPYFRAIKEDWDRQWQDASAFLAWLDKVAAEWQRLLKPNGSLYCFASPQMATKVETLLSKRFFILNSIRWVKEAGNFNKVSAATQRRYVTNWEACIFAEPLAGDAVAKNSSSYSAKCDSLRGEVFAPLREYICGEFERAGMLNSAGKRAADKVCGVKAMASRHYFGKAQWALPTKEHYEAMRGLLNDNDNGDGPYLTKDPDFLQENYTYLKKEYETLRQEFEELRRPFTPTQGLLQRDTWSFKPVQGYPGRHPCEKPQAMLAHILEVSSRPGAVVLDSFMGGGSAGVACQRLGRTFIGIERDAGYFVGACQRLDLVAAELPLVG